MGRLKSQFEDRSRQSARDVRSVALAISRIPYGRPRAPSPEGVLAEWRGTCSTKHVLFAAVVAEAWPELRPRLWHRPYLVTPDLVEERWGAEVAAVVPAAGLTDVHTYATVELAGRSVQVDVTFPIAGWDGGSDLPLACGPGEDIPAGDDALSAKARLVAEHCDPVVREPFIAALARAHAEAGPAWASR